jgi:hypothetical protein
VQTLVATSYKLCFHTDDDDMFTVPRNRKLWDFSNNRKFWILLVVGVILNYVHLFYLPIELLCAIKLFFNLLILSQHSNAVIKSTDFLRTLIHFSILTPLVHIFFAKSSCKPDKISFVI